MDDSIDNDLIIRCSINQRERKTLEKHSPPSARNRMACIRELHDLFQRIVHGPGELNGQLGVNALIPTPGISEFLIGLG